MNYYKSPAAAKKAAGLTDIYGTGVITGAFYFGRYSLPKNSGLNCIILQSNAGSGGMSARCWALHQCARFLTSAFLTGQAADIAGLQKI